MSARACLRTLVLLLSASAVAMAQEPKPKPSEPKPSDPKPSAQLDTAFMEKANRANLTEVAMGKLATSKAENMQVKDFGRKMITDHEAMNSELTQLASRKSIKIPGELTKDEQKAIDEMGKQAGKEFDKHYMTHMVSDHEKAVALFKSTAAGAADQDIKDFATRALPKLESHLTEAKALRDKVSGEKDDHKPKPKPEKPEKPVKPADKP